MKRPQKRIRSVVLLLSLLTNTHIWLLLVSFQFPIIYSTSSLPLPSLPQGTYKHTIFFLLFSISHNLGYPFTTSLPPSPSMQNTLEPVTVKSALAFPSKRASPRAGLDGPRRLASCSLVYSGKVKATYEKSRLLTKSQPKKP
jgi:hypothetical protein